MAAATVTSEIIENLDPYDFDKAIDLLEKLNLDTDGVEDVEQAQHRLRLYLAAQEQSGEDETDGPKGKSRYNWNARNVRHNLLLH